MKKIITLFLVLTSLVFFAQTPPVIESTYFPVRNTSIKQVWDTIPGNMAVPTIGPNQLWDYTFANNQFTIRCDTFSFKTLDPAVTPYQQYFPAANHAVFIRTPFKDFSDSLFNYFQVTQSGFYNIGGFNTKHAIDSTAIYSNSEYFSPSLLTYNSTFTDTARYVAFVKRYKYLGNDYKVKVKGTKIKTLNYVGYGTLKIPNGIYNNVALVRETGTKIDSLYIDLANTGNFTYLFTGTTSAIVYEFLRNNTFGSAYLAYLSANPANTQINYGWYTLPVDFGSISGSVFTSTAETTPVASGKAYLYRENSNFAKNDILAKANLDASGNFNFDSIPYGEYRIAIRPDTLLYPNSLITYYGDTTNWIDASTIITTTTTSTGHKIHIHYAPAPIGSNSIVGNIGLNLSIYKTSNILVVNPIKGVGIVVKKNPGSSAERVLVTDTTGKFNAGNLNNGSYKLFVDIPGLHMTGTYNFTVSNGTVINGLDFTVGTDSIHPYNSLTIGVKENNKPLSELLSAYPNPYSSFATIVVTIPESAKVLLEVYNMLGEKIQTIDNNQKQAGVYKYNFSAKNLNKSAGMYFVKLAVGNKTSVIKLIEH